MASDKELSRQPFRFEDPRQERIYRRLRDFVGPGPADFFKDACQLMAGPASLATTSHLISHLLREVESALRDVLETMAEREKRLQKSKKEGHNHKEEILAILRGLQISEADPVARVWLILPGKGNGYGLDARAHRNALTSARPVDEDFRQFWNDMQGIFNVVLDKFETNYVAVYHFLDQLLAKQVPTQSDVDKLKNHVPNNIVAHGYFFDRLTSPEWLDILHVKGLFSHPQAAEVDDEQGTIGYAAWPQSRYLARMAPQAPRKVLDIMLTVPATHNIRIYEDFASAAALMPVELIAKWSQREAVRLTEQEHLFGLLPDRLGVLINHLLQGDFVADALILARSLLDILPDPRAEKQKENKDEYRPPPEPRARFSAWEYRRILERMITLLPPAGRMPAFDLFGDLLAKALRFSKSSSEEESGTEDYSHIWYPRLEDKPHGDHLRNLLVPVVRDLAHTITDHDPTQLPALVEKLENRRYDVFHRIALDLLRKFSDAALSLIAARLTDQRLFDARGPRREYDLLALESFGHLRLEDQQKILTWIEAGPDVEAYKQWRREVSGQEPANEDVARHVKMWQRDRLAPLHKSLPSDWKQRYEDLTREVGKPERDVTENARTRIWHGPTSSKTSEDFQSMSVQEIVTYLSSWEPTHEPMSPSREGLGRQLTATVQKDPLRFATEAEKFRGLDPTYVRSLLQGIRQGISETKDLPWSAILSLCHWVVSQPITIEARQVDNRDRDPDWGWTRKAIAGLLGAGLRECPSMVAFILRSQVWNILENLTDDPDPSPDDEAIKDSPIDPSHIAINSTRGEAMETVVCYALWVRSHLERFPDGSERINRCLQEMPEVGQVLETHLDLARDPSLAIRSVYGRWFPSLMYLDAEWTTNHVGAIFPHENGLRRYRNAAWDTYIVFCNPYSIVFEVLQEEYRDSIEHLGSPGTTRLDADGISATHLAEHLMTFYWQGKLSLEDETGMLPRFYAKSTDALRREALEYVGRSLRETDGPLPEEISFRLKELWETRLAKIRDSGIPNDHTAELATFGWWFASEKFDDPWAISQLLGVLSLIQKAEPDYLVVERLVVLAATMPLEVVQCLTLMVQGDKQGWDIRGWGNDCRKILSTAVASGSSAAIQAAIDLVNRLAAKGMPDYKDLLPGSAQG